MGRWDGITHCNGDGTRMNQKVQSANKEKDEN